jgi:hypothetical protein
LLFISWFTRKKEKMKKLKSIKSIIGIGAIGAIGLGVSASITSCGKATTTDVVSFSNDYLPSMSRGREQTFHASSSMDGKITYSIGDHPDGVTIEDNILNYSTSATVNENTNVTIIATSDKGGHSSIKITLLADTPTPTLSATIIANDLNLSDLDSFAVLSVTEINTDA